MSVPTKRLLKSEKIPWFAFLSHTDYRWIMGPVLMISAAIGFAVLDSLIKLLGPSYRVWDIAFYRWGIGFVLLLIILISWRFWTGGSLILAGAVMINLIKARPRFRIQRSRL